MGLPWTPGTVCGELKIPQLNSVQPPIVITCRYLGVLMGTGGTSRLFPAGSLEQDLSEEGISSDPGRTGCLGIDVNSLVNDSANPKWHVIVMEMLHCLENKILI